MGSDQIPVGDLQLLVQPGQFSVDESLIDLHLVGFVACLSFSLGDLSQLFFQRDQFGVDLRYRFGGARCRVLCLGLVFGSHRQLVAGDSQLQPDALGFLLHPGKVFGGPFQLVDRTTRILDGLRVVVLCFDQVKGRRLTRLERRLRVLHLIAEFDQVLRLLGADIGLRRVGRRHDPQVDERLLHLGDRCLLGLERINQTTLGVQRPFAQFSLPVLQLGDLSGDVEVGQPLCIEFTGQATLKLAFLGEQIQLAGLGVQDLVVEVVDLVGQVLNNGFLFFPRPRRFFNRVTFTSRDEGDLIDKALLCFDRIVQVVLCLPHAAQGVESLPLRCRPVLQCLDGFLRRLSLSLQRR